MARRYEDPNKDHFDLLPFIAILMCTLGCLLLVTMSMAALSIGPGAGVGIIPESSTKDPILIEWDRDTAIVHSGNRRTSIQWSGPSSPQSDEGNVWDLFQSRKVTGLDFKRFWMNWFLNGKPTMSTLSYALKDLGPLIVSLVSFVVVTLPSAMSRWNKDGRCACLKEIHSHESTSISRKVP